MPAPLPGYTVRDYQTAIAASTTKTILMLIGGANDYPVLCQLKVSFDSTSTTLGKVRVQVVQSTQATAGTSTAGTVNQVRGYVATSNITAAVNYTVEPTVLSVVDEFLVDATTGFILPNSLSREFQGHTSSGTVKGLGVRIITPAGGTVGYAVTAEYED